MLFRLVHFFTVKVKLLGIVHEQSLADDAGWIFMRASLRACNQPQFFASFNFACHDFANLIRIQLGDFETPNDLIPRD